MRLIHILASLFVCVFVCMSVHSFVCLCVQYACLVSLFDSLSACMLVALLISIFFCVCLFLWMNVYLFDTLLVCVNIRLCVYLSNLSLSSLSLFLCLFVNLYVCGSPPLSPISHILHPYLSPRAFLKRYNERWRRGRTMVKNESQKDMSKDEE